MSIADKFIAGLLLLLLTATGVLGLTAYVQTKRLDAAKEAARIAVADTSAHATASSEVRKVYEDKEKTRAELEVVIKAHPEWSDGHVPDDVAHFLRHPTGATRAVPE